MASATVQVNVRLEPARYESLKAEARRQGRTVTAVVDEAVETYLALVTPQKSNPPVTT
jgi:predicted DNA-binding protein